MKPTDVHECTVDVETILDMLDEARELYLTIRADQVQSIKQRLSQAKHKRGTNERMRMTPGPSFNYALKLEDGSSKVIRALDIHLQLGSGSEVFVLRCKAVDDTL